MLFIKVKIKDKNSFKIVDIMLSIVYDGYIK